MRKITEEQIQMIKNAFYQENVPVKLYMELQKLLDGLPKIEVQEEKDKCVKK